MDLLDILAECSPRYANYLNHCVIICLYSSYLKWVCPLPYYKITAVIIKANVLLKYLYYWFKTVENL